MKKREITLPTIMGLLIAGLGLATGVVLLRSQVGTSASAANGETPTEVRITNIDDASFAVSWTTDKPVQGFVQYGESGRDPGLVVSDERDQLKGVVGTYQTHYVAVRGLKPATSYVFKIGSGKGLYDQQGHLFTTKTGATIADSPVADVAYGQVVKANGEPGDGAVVYLQISGAVAQSALVKASGSWVIPLSTARTADLNRFVTYDKDTTRLEIVVQGGGDGTATVSLMTKNHTPVPDIVLGTNADWTVANVNTQAPTSPSKFTSDPAAVATEILSPDTLQILTPKFGEEVNSATPQIIGKAPAGASLKIEVHSTTKITDTIKADDNGNFSYTVPNNLEPGEHTITISSVIGGVVKSVTRSFVVQAAGESFMPAFVATPSASLTPTTKPKPSAKPTATPKPTTTPKPTATPKVATGTPTITPSLSPTVTTVPTISPTLAPSPTPASMPQSGNDGPTWVLLIIGLTLLGIGSWWYKKAI